MSAVRSDNMKSVLTVVALLALLTSVSFGFPAPFPKPKQSIEEASRTVIQFHNETKPDLAKYKPIVQQAEFSTYAYSRKLQEVFPELADESTQSNAAWLRSEWGWIITVAMSQDLSSTCLYFLKASGEVVFLGASD